MKSDCSLHDEKTICSHSLDISKKFLISNYLFNHENSSIHSTACGVSSSSPPSSASASSLISSCKVNNKNPFILEKKISVEVVLTEDKLHELMKCKPTEEWISRGGKSLRHSFPELAYAHTKDLQIEQEQKRKSTIPPLQPLPISVQYNTLCNWKGLQSNELVQSTYVKLIKYILLRETSFRRLNTLLDTLESSYWKYSCVVIDRIQFSKSIVTDEVLSIIKMIHTRQQELSIAIAHHRSLSIDVVETIIRFEIFFFLVTFIFSFSLTELLLLLLLN